MAWTDPIDTAVTGAIAPAAMWNEVRDNFALIGPHLIVRKPADESVVSSTAQQNDDHLLAAVVANEVWYFEWVLKFNGSSSGDLVLQWTFPTGGDLTASVVELDAAGSMTANHVASTTSPAGSMTFACQGATSHIITRIPMIYVNGANAGNVQLQWAQFASNATATRIMTNSTLWGVKLA